MINNNNFDHVFYDLPTFENFSYFFEQLSSNKEERHFLAQKLLSFYLQENHIVDISTSLKEQYLVSIHLLIISFSYIVMNNDIYSFHQFIRRFIYESREDSQEVFLLKKFFLTNFDSSQEYYIGQIALHSDIKKRTDILLDKYIQFFPHYC